MKQEYKAIRVNRLDEPGPMVRICIFESLQDAKTFLEGGKGLVTDSKGAVLFQKGEGK